MKPPRLPDLLTLFALGAAGLALPACNVTTEGLLGAGTFRAQDCSTEMCLANSSFASDSRSRLVFRPHDEPRIDGVRSTDPAVMRIDAVTVGAEETVFDVTAVALGNAELVVDGQGQDGVVDRLPIVVSDVALAEVVVAGTRTVVGGTAFLASAKRGFDGRDAIGRGGYQPLLPAGLVASPAPLSLLGIWGFTPDFVVTAEAEGQFTVSADHAPAGWSESIEVLAAARVVGMQMGSSGFAATTDGRFLAYVDHQGVDDQGEGIFGIPCAWRTSRPVAMEPWVGGEIVRSDTSAPLDLTCVFDGRDLATVHIVLTPPSS